MTTYTLNGIYGFEAPTPANNEAGLATLDIVMPAGTSTFSYSVNPLPPGAPPEEATVTLNIAAGAMRLNGVTLDSDIQPVFQMIAASWTDGSGVARNTTVLGVSLPMSLTLPGNEPNTAALYFFYLGGDPLPPVATWTEWSVLSTSVSGISLPTGALAPDTVIDLNTLPGSSSPSMLGTSGNDVLTGTAGGETIEGLGGNDTIDAKGGNDRIFTGYGNDNIRGGAGDDFISPGGGKDWSGEDVVDAGTGNDTISFTGVLSGYVHLLHDGLDAGIAVNIDVQANTASVDKGANGTTSIIDVANPVIFTGNGYQGGGMGVWGTGFADTFNIANAANGWIQVYGGAGNDTFNIAENGGIVRLTYKDAGVTSGVRVNLATGVVTNDGWGGTDTINGSVREVRGTMLQDRITGSAANERFILMGGDDILKGGGGIDMVRYDRPGVDAVSVDLAAGTATGTWNGVAFAHSLSGIEAIRGSRDADDILRGAAADNQIFGRGGNDLLAGRAGNDTLYGEDGNDTLNGGRGADLLDGGNGIDIASYSFAATAVTVDMQDGTQNTGEAAGDTLVWIENLMGSKNNDILSGDSGANRIDGGKGGDRIDGRDGNDVLLGSGGNDRMIGGKGSDLLKGGAGKDRMAGGNGNDTLQGGGGNDRLDGGRGSDILTGGAGKDVFVFSAGNDQITDFNTASNREKIDLSGVASIKGFRDLSNNHLSEAGGEAVITDDAGNTLTLLGVAMADLDKGDFIF